MRIENDGIYHLPSFDFGAKNAYYGFRFLKLQESCNITIEQLPLYPGALVFDGVDDCGTCDNFPVLTKEKGYTVVALRQWITRGEIAQGLVSNVKNWLKDGAFLLEYRNIQADHLNKPISFGAIGSEMDLPHILTYQTSKSYNGVSITTGNFEGTDVLHVGKLAPTNVGTCINAAIWEPRSKTTSSKPIPGSSPTKHGQSPAKPTRTKIVLLLPTLRAMVIILYCRILHLVGIVGMGNTLTISMIHLG